MIPRAEAAVKSLAPLGSLFSYPFPANSLTVLNLATSGGLTGTQRQIKVGKRSSSASLVPVGARSTRRATLVIRRGGRVSPTAISVPPPTPLELTLVSADRRVHRVAVRGSGKRLATVPAHRRIRVRLKGVKPGRHVVTIDGVARAVLLAGGRFGAGSG